LRDTVKRRTSVATLFPNEAALLRLVRAVLMDIREEWETGKIYLRMKHSGPIPREEGICRKFLTLSNSRPYCRQWSIAAKLSGEADGVSRCSVFQKSKRRHSVMHIIHRRML